MNMKKLTTVMVAGILSVTVSSVFAANVDAPLTVGAASTGNFDLSIVKGDAVSIAGMQTLNIVSGPNTAVDPSGSIDVCTYVSTANYRLEINSLGTGGANALATSIFDAEDTAGNVMPFSVAWVNGATNLNFSDNASGRRSGNPSTNQTDPTCGGGTNTTISATIAAAAFNLAPVGTYSDTLEVIITAQ